MKWLQALKVWNQGKEKWCVPRKGTKEHAEVKALMEHSKPEKVKERNEERGKKALEQLRAFETKVKESNKAKKQEAFKKAVERYNERKRKQTNETKPTEEAKPKKSAEEAYREYYATLDRKGRNALNVRRRYWVKKGLSEDEAKTKVLKGSGFWSDFADGFMSVVKPVASIAKTITGFIPHPVAQGVSGVLGALGAGKPTQRMINWEKLHWGAFSKQFEVYKRKHKDFKGDMKDFADYVVANPDEFAKTTVKRANFYKNVILKGKGAPKNEIVHTASHPVQKGYGKPEDFYMYDI